MTANTLKQKNEQVAEPEKKASKPKKESSVGKTAHSIIDGTIITRANVIKHLPLLLFFTLLAIIYIANSYRAQKIAMATISIKNELKELRYQHIETQSMLMNQSRQSEVVKEIESTGLKEAKEPAKIIRINESDQINYSEKEK